METTDENIQATMEKEKVMASLDIEETFNSATGNIYLGQV